MKAKKLSCIAVLTRGEWNGNIYSVMFPLYKMSMHSDCLENRNETINGLLN